MLNYKKLEVKIPKVRVATGLYSNWDSFVKINKKTLNWIKTSEKLQPKRIVLNSIKEVTYILDKSREEKGEHLISKKVYNQLDLLFKERERSLGGNGNNMGRILFALGLKPLVSYPCRPKELMLTSPNFKIACGNKIKSPKKTIREKDLAYDHIIFQFKNSRQIFSWDLMSSQGIFDYDFLNFACNSKYTDILILGFAHLLLPKYKKRTDEIVDRLEEKRPKVHLEFGSGSEESMKYAMKKFADHNCVDSFGLDENECIAYLGAKSPIKDDLIYSALNAMEKYDLERICVHTLNFAFSISKIPIKKEFNSLATACLMASVQTFGKLDFKCARALSPGMRPIKEKIDNYSICFLPTLINPSPKILTGIGDVFAAVQAVKALS